MTLQRMDVKTTTILAAALSLMACGAGVDSVTGDQTSSSDESALSQPAYWAVAQDASGYWMSKVNREAAPQRAASLDLTALSMTDTLTQDLNQVGGQWVVLGRFGAKDPQTGARTFIATDAFRGLDDNATCGSDMLWKLDANGDAQMLNSTEGAQASSVDTSAAVQGWVQADWVAHQVVAMGAIFSAKPSSSGLAADQVFLRATNGTPACPRFLLSTCPEQTVRTTERSADRCAMPQACVAQSVCPRFVPQCAAGYQLSTWTGANGCPAFACDPVLFPAPN